MKRMLLFGAVAVVALACSVMSYAGELVWLANTEEDMSKYHVYMCKTKGCTATDQGALWVGEVLHVKIGGPTHYTFKIADDIVGAAVVVAQDDSGLVSLPSNMVSFSTVINRPPPAPQELLFR